MEKYFDAWNEKKKTVHGDEISHLFHEREVWWCSLGVNVGYEQDGKHEQFERPVLILKKFSKHVAWIIPLTSRAHEDIFHYRLKNQKSFLVLSQLRLISSKRLLAKMEKITENEHKEIFEILKRFMTTEKISSKKN